jgi:hypothetical protein
MTTLRESQTHIPAAVLTEVREGDRVRIECADGTSVYLVGERDLALLRDREDAEDNLAADRALAEPGGNISFKEAKARLGL